MLKQKPQENKTEKDHNRSNCQGHSKLHCNCSTAHRCIQSSRKKKESTKEKFLSEKKDGRKFSKYGKNHKARNRRISRNPPPKINMKKSRLGCITSEGDKGKRFQTARTERTKLPLEEKN